MNITTPLAAALLMTASAAMAQTLSAPNAGIFKNGASSGVCLPNDTQCQNGFMTGPGAGNPTQTIAAYTPPAGKEWASKDCQHISCALKDDDPIKPFKDSTGRKTELKKAMDEQKKLTPDAKIIDMGDGRYAMDLGNGTVTLGGTSDGVNGVSSMPRPMSAVPGLKEKFAAQDAKDKTQAEVADKSKAMWDASSGGGTTQPTASATDANPQKGAKGAAERSTDLPDKSAAPPSARDLGAEFAGDQGDMMGGFGAESASDEAPGNVAGNDDRGVIKIAGRDAQAQADSRTYTYTKIKEAAEESDRIITGGAATFKTRDANDGVEGVKPTPTAASAQ